MVNELKKDRVLKVFISPPNSLILYNLVRKYGCEPLSIMREIEKKVRDPEIDSPPKNITPSDVREGLKYCTVEVPSGVRGRLSLLAKLIEEADSAIIVDDPDFEFGCSGCARTNEFLKYLVYERGIPYITLKYPRSDEEAEDFVNSITGFLEKLQGG
ncbi:MAG: methanogenesis marker 5 protein [archaeon]|nr:methanogenesis marker 5 protein [archaeon]MCP8315109.1 methanogenesis marker 5 protein [archaeon]MCP8317197.1 methanogenesis marker 5 protein [archaeon]MCP8320708.1 methanogenesis marker 5 protein [archaeon]